MSEQNVAIPDEGDVKAIGGAGVWRFAEGEIVRGQTGAIEKREGQAPAGLLRRVGIHEKEAEDGTNLKYLEIDLETSKGVEFFHCPLLNTDGELAPSSPAVGLAYGLIQIGKNDQIRLTCSQSDPVEVEVKGKKIKVKMTYLNVWKSKDQDWKFEQIIRARAPKDQPRPSLLDQWLALEPQIRAHPAFAERPASRSDDGEGNAQTHLSALVKECEAKGWPTPEQAPNEWLGIMAKFNSEDAPRAGLSSWPDHEWGEIRQHLATKTDVPSWLAPAVQRLAGGAAKQSNLLD